jgi:heme-degrading monooxygenase HmoA
MFMTTTQYSIACGAAARFENVWQITKELLTQVDGFLRLDFQKGPENDGKTTYFILTMWESEQNYLSWRGCGRPTRLPERTQLYVEPAKMRYNLYCTEAKKTLH